MGDDIYIYKHDLLSWIMQCIGTIQDLCVTIVVKKPYWYLHYCHTVLWLEGNLQHFGPIHQPLYTRRGDRLPSDAVDLVESVWFQGSLVGCSYVDL